MKRLSLPLFLFLGGMLAFVPLSTILSQHRTSILPSASSETPWVRYVMVGLGGFRGIISEVLWMRATSLQEQGRYFELIQLTDWINALDPRSADAWSYNAWNLAYNISALLPDPNARLQWVNAGISLLRDRAIPANPSTPSLYRELGWLYQNKIGSDDDSAFTTYRLALARESTQYSLDPSVISEIESKFGKLDWRLPNTHAIYWATCGLRLNPTGFEYESLRRMVQQNLVALVSAGHFTGDLERNIWKTSTAFEIVPHVMNFYEESAKTDPNERRIYCIFLQSVTAQLQAAGRNDLATITARRLAELSPPSPPSP